MCVCLSLTESSSSLLSPIHRKPENKVPELTLERAVNLLGQDNEEIQITAASFIQNQCFNSSDAKKMVSWGPSLLLLTWLLN